MKNRPKKKGRGHVRELNPLGLPRPDLPPDFADTVRDIALFADCESPAAARSLLREQIQVEVDAIVAVLADADAFDVIELMRLRELSLAGDREAGPPGSSALAVEIVAAVLLSRDSRKPSPVPRDQTRPYLAVGELHDRAQRLTRLAQARQLVEARLSEDPLARLAAQYQGAVLGIRNMQYACIRDAHEAALFDNDRAAALMQRHLGYTYPDVVSVRSATTSLSSDRMTALRDQTAEIMMRHEGVPPAQVPADDASEFMSKMISMMFLPADRATLAAHDVAAAAGVSEKTAHAVLSSYSQNFDSSIPAADRVYDMLVGENPFLATPLVSDGSGNFVLTSNEIGNDSLRRIFERALTSDSRDFGSYEKKLRLPMSERIALDALARIIHTAPAQAGFKYYAHTEAGREGLLHAECSDPGSVGKQVEGDGLFIVDDVAIVVETKGKSMADQSRRGDVKRLLRDLTATVGDACAQAKRVQDLIEANHGIWLANGTWFDLAHIREVRSVVVLLDDVGPLGTAIGQLQEAGIVSNVMPPWISSLHDLSTIAQVCDRPAEFLHYLRVRTDSPATSHFLALDELDLYMLFLQGDLWVDKDEAAGINVVDDHCRELNAWMDRHAAHEIDVPNKPSFNAVPATLELVDAISTGRAPGWLRCGADLLSLDGKVQRQIFEVVSELRRRAEADSDYHHCLISFDSLWGRPGFFLAVQPIGMDDAEVTTRLSTYMAVKAAEIEAERFYGLVFDIHGRLQHQLYR